MLLRAPKQMTSSSSDEVSATGDFHINMYYVVSISSCLSSKVNEVCMRSRYELVIFVKSQEHSLWGRWIGAVWLIETAISTSIETYRLRPGPGVSPAIVKWLVMSEMFGSGVLQITYHDVIPPRVELINRSELRTVLRTSS
jgi:hypothetical protein